MADTPLSFNFQKTKVWQEAMEWSIKVHSTKFKPEGSELLGPHLYTAAQESVNLIAEGKSYYPTPILQSFLRRSRSRVYRTVSILLLMKSLNLVAAKDCQALLEHSYAVARHLGALARYFDKEDVTNKQEKAKSK